jgi:hypothetical protein
MIARQPATLESLHRNTGKLLRYGQRLLVAIFIMGPLFCLLSISILKLIRQPEAFLNTQAFMVNYTEAAQGDAASEITANNHVLRVSKPKDPNWDGTLAGASVGFSLGQNIPLIGVIGGPVLGAIIGYEMDSRI